MKIIERELGVIQASLRLVTEDILTKKKDTGFVSQEIVDTVESIERNIIRLLYYIKPYQNEGYKKDDYEEERDEDHHRDRYESQTTEGFDKFKNLIQSIKT